MEGMLRGSLAYNVAGDNHMDRYMTKKGCAGIVRHILFGK